MDCHENQRFSRNDGYFTYFGIHCHTEALAEVSVSIDIT